MIVYLDASSIVSTYLAETGRKEVVDTLVDDADAVVTSLIAYAEVRAGLAMANREPASRPRLGRAAYRQAVSAFLLDWPAFSTVTISEELVTHAGDLAEQHALKGYDAVHLAAAIDSRVDVR